MEVFMMRREHLLTFMQDKVLVFQHVPARLVCYLIVCCSVTASSESNDLSSSIRRKAVI